MMSENWIPIEHGVYSLYKSVDNKFLCQAYENTKKYGMMLMRSCFIRDLNLIDSPISKYPWCAEFADETRDGYKIFLHFDGILCQEILDRGEKLEDYCPDWKQQLEQMCVDLHKEEICKLSMYPKCFFINSNKQLKAFGHFSSSRYLEQPMNMEMYMPLFNDERGAMVNKLMVGGTLDMRLLREKAFNEYIKWPDDVLPAIYSRVYQS
jgi:hypothetical protein